MSKAYYDIHKEMEKEERFCVNCGTKENIEIHHIVPLSKGGSNTRGECGISVY